MPERKVNHHFYALEHDFKPERSIDRSGLKHKAHHSQAFLPDEAQVQQFLGRCQQVNCHKENLALRIEQEPPCEVYANTVTKPGSLHFTRHFNLRKPSFRSLRNPPLRYQLESVAFFTHIEGHYPKSVERSHMRTVGKLLNRQAQQ